jgi:hypothetical protein
MTLTFDRRELMVMHVDALFVHDDRGRMVRVNEPSGKRAPRFFLGRTREGRVCRFRDDVTDDAIAALEAAVRAEDADAADRRELGAERYEEILARFASVEQVSGGPAYAFASISPAPPNVVQVTDANRLLLEPLLAPWLPDVEGSPPLMALVEGGRAVAVCGSVRMDRGYEAGVETHPDYRGRGYAGGVVSAWAAAVRAMDRVPLYSTSWQNTSSQAVARKLGLVMFGADVQIT